MISKIFLATISIFFITTAVISEQVAGQTYTISNASTMTIYGSSNVTDWEAEVKTINGTIVIRNTENADWSEADASWFQRVEISIPVSDIDADSRRMNNNMHNYLKAGSHPNITYRMLEATELIALDNPGSVLVARGRINAAGANHEIEHEVEINKNEEGKLTISGSHDLLMTDFGIDPPTAMLGSIRSHDKVTIEFNLILE